MCVCILVIVISTVIKPLLCVSSLCVGMLIFALFNVNLFYLDVCERINLSLFCFCLYKCVCSTVYAYITCPGVIMCKHNNSFTLFICVCVWADTLRVPACGICNMSSNLDTTKYNKLFSSSFKTTQSV